MSPWEMKRKSKKVPHALTFHKKKQQKKHKKSLSNYHLINNNMNLGIPKKWIIKFNAQLDFAKILQKIYFRNTSQQLNNWEKELLLLNTTK